MNKPQHTPTPWAASRNGEIYYADSKIEPRIATVHNDNGTTAQMQADAAFICKAVNSHQALVEALEALFKECCMTHKHWGEGSNQRESDAAIEAARKALEQAKCS